MIKTCETCQQQYNAKHQRKRFCSSACADVASTERQRNSATHGHARGGRPTPTYLSWRSAIVRCSNPNATGYENYGGRGIAVCERWSSFANFLDDMGERPDGRSLDRINVNGDYEPNNCRWATLQEQVLTRRIPPRVTRDQIVEKHLEGMRPKDIAAHFNVSSGLVSTQLSRWRRHDRR